jgi:hypothetical protein
MALRTFAGFRPSIDTNPMPSSGSDGGAVPGYVVDHIVPLTRGGAERAGKHVGYQIIRL